MAYRRQQSPRGNRRKHRDDPHRMSTGSLPVSPEGYYGGPPPAAPPAPAGPGPSYHHNNYSLPQSPVSSDESIGAYTQGPQGGHMRHPSQHHGYAPAPPAPPAPAPAPAPPPPGMRGGDAGHMYSGGHPGVRRRNTLAGHRQNIIHQQQPHLHEYEPHPEFDYRGLPPRPPPAMPRGSRSSSRTRDRDLSPPGSAGGSSNFSGGSFEPSDRHKSHVLPSDSRRPNNREYRLNGPLPGERDFRGGGGTVYHPAGGNRPVLGGERRRERSRSRGPHGLGLSNASGDGMSDEYLDDHQMYEPRAGGRRMVGANVGPNAGALVRSRSRSAPASESRAMIPQPPASESDGSSSSSSSGTAPPAGTGIRLEYAGNSVDITYTGNGGKPVSIGSITINTRTTAVPANPSAIQAIAAPPMQAIAAPPMQAITAPPGPPTASPAPPPPAPPVQSVMIPPPPAPGVVPPPGVEPVMLPPPPPMMPGSFPPSRKDVGVNPEDDRGVRESLYRNMEALALEPARYHDRGRDREIMPPSGMRAMSHRQRSRSRSRRPADDELRWTKISRDIVARRAVEVKGYDFEEQPDSIVIFQVLDEVEIDELIDLSERIRSGEVRVVRRDEQKRHRRRQSQHRHGSHSRPQSVHGYPLSGGPGPSANRPPPSKPAIVIPTAPDPPRAETPAPPPPPVAEAPGSHRAGRPTENPNKPGTYIGYSRNPPRSAAGSGPYYRHVKGGG